jgi:hypothetical protein
MSDVMQLYSKDYSFIEDNADLDDDIEDVHQPTLHEESSAPGKLLPIRFGMFHSTVRLFDIALK